MQTLRAVIGMLSFWRRYGRLLANYIAISERVARLEEHNRLLIEAATERARKLQEREAEFTEIATETGRKFQERVAKLEEHNRLLTDAATQRARRLQEREAEFAEMAIERARKFQEHVAKLEEHNRLLTDAATERARRLQEREAELTQALAVMSQRVARLSEHNRWLTETAMDAVSELQGNDAETTVLRRAFEERIIQQLQQIDESIQALMTQQQVLIGIDQAGPRVHEPSHKCRPSSSDSSDGGTRRYLKGHEQQPRYSPQQKHVLMVTSGLTRGGCERQILATADGLLRQGYQIQIFCFASLPGEPDFANEFSHLGIKCCHAFELGDSTAGRDHAEDVHSVEKFAQLVDHLDVIAIARALAQTIKEFRPAIVHCWSDFANVIGGLVSTNLRVPKVVLGQRNLPAFRYVDGIAPHACREAYRILAQNPNVSMLNNSSAGLTKYAKWLDVPNDKIKLLYNGFLVNGIHIRNGSEAEVCRRHLGLTKDMQVVGAVMRFSAEKDPHLWLETAAAIAAARPGTCFVLAGYGDLAEQVEHRIQTLGLAERFILPGATKDVGLIYGALDVFLMTSRFEGTPNVLIEAQAAGVPAVAPNVGGTSETLLDGITGLVVGNRRASNLSSAVLQILDDPGWRGRAAIHGPAFVSKRFGHQRMIDETIVEYDCVV
jgi:glycosyltransferase involved in cell wall biosynthesis